MVTKKKGEIDRWILKSV